MHALRLRIICGTILCAAMAGAVCPAYSQHSGTRQAEKRETGYAVKKPVFGGSGPTGPWGVVGDFLKEAMKATGWDIQICGTCAGGPRAARMVAAAAVPPKPAPGSKAPVPPNGPVDFGATATQFLWWAYQGTHDFANDPGTPQKQLRLVATIQDPSFMLIAVKADSGITDLRQIREKHLPVRVVVLAQGGDTNQAILSYYGLTKEALASWGGTLLRGSPPGVEQPKNPDVIIGFGELVRPEYEAWIDFSQRLDLKFLELPKDLRANLVKDYDCEPVTIPEGLFRGVDRAFPGVGRSGDAVYGRTDMPDAFGYALAKAIDEHQDLLRWTIVPLSYNPKIVWKAIGVPLQPGAARYYRERGYMK
jgi:uncharacterized protein